ncbi:hypothetical protein P106B_79 [Rhizobium phage vB_RglS_P106B]|uniref:Uncharacterized protein n=1 Tax=Rhizobium phage vB_RglS_P106B TaxID=1458697 RepID=W6EC47_9CAUD|nr:hypothetical protein P106B_79 [Rhizobium phage vB_RglS_P106B]AHJ10762.1 hypothetical protein P106B_79 [Rhizobium phage vB_RglS_P106B]
MHFVACCQPDPTKCKHIWGAQTDNALGATLGGCSFAVCMNCGVRADHAISVMVEPEKPATPREPPRIGYYEEAGLHLNKLNADNEPLAVYPKFNEAMLWHNRGITAEQAREAAHLLNQLAEYLECTGR